MSDELLTPQQVADLLQVHVSTISRWAKSGLLASVRIGDKTLRFRRADVEALFAPDDPAEVASA